MEQEMEDMKPLRGTIKDWFIYEAKRKGVVQGLVCEGYVYDHPSAPFGGIPIRTSLIVSIKKDDQDKPIEIETLNSRYKLGDPEPSVANPVEDQDGE